MGPNEPDEDGHPVTLKDPNGKPVPVGQQAELEVGRPAAIAPGSMLNAAFALSVPSMPLPPGRYTWRLNFADVLDSESFAVQA